MAQDLARAHDAIRECSWHIRGRLSRMRRRAYDACARGIRGGQAPVDPSELIKVSPEICTNLFGFSYGMRGWHYLTALLREHADSPRLRYQDSVLRRFHERYQPADMSDLVAHRFGVAFRPPVGVYPWGSFDVALSRAGGRPKPVWQSRQYGPTEPRLIKWDFSNVLSLFHRMQRSGYQPRAHESGFITGVFLCRANGERRFFVLDGTHRCAILSFLGSPIVEMRYAPGCYREIREQDVDEWYYVKQGLCSRTDALAYFHAYFELNGLERARRMGLIGPHETLRAEPARAVSSRSYWERKQDPDVLQAFEEGRERVMEESGIGRGASALDLGSGTGRWLPALASRFETVTATEPDDRIRQALARSVGQDPNLRGKVTVSAGTAESLPFADGTFDAVFCKNALQYTDQARALEEIRRVLKPSGRLFFNSNAAGYFLLQIALGLRHRVPAKVRYGIACFAGTVVSQMTGRRFVGQRFSSIRWARRLMQDAGFRVVRAEPWSDHDLFPLRFMGCLTHFAVLGVAPGVSVPDPEPAMAAVPSETA